MRCEKADDYLQRLVQLMTKRWAKDELNTGVQYGYNKNTRYQGEKNKTVQVWLYYTANSACIGPFQTGSDSFCYVVCACVVRMLHYTKAAEVGRHLVSHVEITK